MIRRILSWFGYIVFTKQEILDEVNRAAPGLHINLVESEAKDEYKSFKLFFGGYYENSYNRTYIVGKVYRLIVRDALCELGEQLLPRGHK